MEVNKYQTPITDELLFSLSQEEQTDLLDYINNVPFIQHLISPNRLYAKDLPKDEYGRIIVDLCKPHILTDMDYFRQVGLHYEQHGCFTKLKPNGNPNSEYGKWYRRELKRCWNGLVRPSDGEWIPGKLYYYWNYSPITISRIIPGTKIADRVSAFPEIWELTYLWAHYEDQARFGGMYDGFVGGKDAGIISRRGAGKSFFKASNMARLFTVGASNHVKEEVRGVLVAYEKEYLNRDGTLNKFVSMIDFLADNTQWPSTRHRNSLVEMSWQMGYQDADTGVIKGTRNEVLGISAKDNPDKVRGKRCVELVYEEFGVFPKFIDTWTTSEYNVREGEFAFGQRTFIGCVCAGTKVWTNVGELVNIEDLYSHQEAGILGYDGDGVYKEKIQWFKEPAVKPCYKIKTSGNNSIECSEDHPLLMTRPHWRNSLPAKTQRLVGHRYDGKYTTFTLAKDLKVGDQLLLIDEVPIFGNKAVKDARLLGLMVGDGNCSIKSGPQLACVNEEIFNYIKARYKYTVHKEFTTKVGTPYRSIGIHGIIPLLKAAGVYGKVKYNKTFPNNIHEYDKQSLSEFIGGYYDADGNITYNKKRDCVRIVLTSMSESLLNEMKYQLLKFGIHANVQKEFRKDGYTPNTYIYRLYITNQTDVIRFQKNITLLCKHKQSILNKVLSVKPKVDGSRFSKGVFKLNKANNKGHFFIGKDNMQSLYQETITEIEFIGDRPVYNMHTKTTNTYLSNMYITKQTGGTEGSDFQGAAEILNSPEAHRVYALPNVFDKSAAGRAKTILFLGGYLNRKGFYNKDGVSDIIGAIISILKDRTAAKYNSTNPLLITKVKAEMPIVLQEAILKIDSTIYPTSELNDAIMAIDADPTHWGKLWIGRLGQQDGKILYLPDDSKEVIKDFPHKDNKLEGAVCIHALPVCDSSGIPPRGRYIAGLDPIDDDESTTLSLFSLYIMDLFTDELVFEYTGRPALADDGYEICRKALLMYNAECNYENNKKGLFKYFSQHNALYLLSDTLEFLKDKEEGKPNYITNKSKGTHALASVNSYARRLIRDWLLSPVVISVPSTTTPGEMVQQETFGLYKIKFRALLRELALWNPDGNFDRHAALGMLMLLREDKLRRLGVQSKGNEGDRIEDDYLGNDEYFMRNYRESRQH